MLTDYARVPIQDQSLELEVEALTKAGWKKVFEDKLSGRRAERAGLTKTWESLREGDTFVLWKFDRLGRSVKHLVDLVVNFTQRVSNSKAHRRNLITGAPASLSVSGGTPIHR